MYAKCNICYTSIALRQFADSLSWCHDVCLENALQNAGNFYSFIDLPKYYHVKPNFVLHLIIQLRQKLARNTIDKNVKTAMTHRKQVQIERNSTIGHTVVTCNQKIRSWFDPKWQIIHQNIIRGGNNLKNTFTIKPYNGQKWYNQQVDILVNYTHLDTSKFNVISFTKAISAPRRFTIDHT